MTVIVRFVGPARDLTKALEPGQVYRVPPAPLAYTRVVGRTVDELGTVQITLTAKGCAR